jgi:hypothetical protein
MKKLLVVSVVTSIIVGCAGRPANPVMVDQIGDNRKSCQSIETEMRFIETELKRLIPETDNQEIIVALSDVISLNTASYEPIEDKVLSIYIIS